MGSNLYLDISWSLKKSFYQDKDLTLEPYLGYMLNLQTVSSQETGEVRDEHFKQFI